MMNKYIYLVGRNKKEVLEKLGDQYNHYPSEIWTYQLTRNWLGRKKFLVLHFKNNIVHTIKLINKW